MGQYIETLLMFAVVLGMTPILGSYMKHIFSGETVSLSFCLRPIEKICYRFGDINEDEKMSWKEYLKALLLFNLLGFLILFFLQLFQLHLPLNPQHFSNISWPSAFNTAISFVTNTNWQSYSGEASLGYLVSLLGLTVQNFLSAATGLCALLVIIRGLTTTGENIGNFWVDLVRSVVYIFLPLSLVLALTLVSEGSIQNIDPYQKIQTLEGYTQVIPQGPVASQVAIKQLGTNGGGYFNTNSAHPFENPSPFTNFLQTISILLIPASLTYMYGLFIQSQRHGWSIFFVMAILWAGGSLLSFYSESMHNPVMNALPHLEGKETRIGVLNSVLWSTATTSTASGSTNCSLTSLSPLSGGVALCNMMLGEVIFGGVGVGLSSMIMFILLTIFLSGLMVGRTPEYLGKKIEKQEIQFALTAILTPSILILLGTGTTCLFIQGTNLGPHSLTEILYAFTSCASNNGSSFASLDCNTTYYNLILAAVMLIGRLAIIVPTIALGGLFACKKSSPHNIGTFSVNTPLFVLLLLSVIFIVGALTFFPALSLGPILEHLLMLKGDAFP